MGATLKIEVTGLDRVFSLYDRRMVHKAVAISIKRTAKSTLTKASTIVRNEKRFNILKRDFDKSMKIKVTDKNPATFTIVLLPKRTEAGFMPGEFGGSFALTKFKAKELRQLKGKVKHISRKKINDKYDIATKIGKRSKFTGGVRVRIKKGGALVQYRQAFIAKMGSGHIGVFRNVDPKKKWTGKIREVKVISTTTMFRNVIPNLHGHAKARWEKEFKSALLNEIRKTVKGTPFPIVTPGK